MKKALLAIFSLIIFQSQATSQQNFLDTIWSGGIMRTFRIYIPAIYDSQSPTPLLLNFHFLGGNASDFEIFSNFKGIADTANFILVTPNGTVNPEFNPGSGQSWSNFDCCPTTDDVLFVSDMLDTLVQAWNVDTTRIYAVGFSNGGMMGYDLACRLSHRITAIASVAGSIEVSRLHSCDPTRSVPIMEIHGTNDQVIPFNGGTFLGVRFIAVDSIVKYWVGYDQCSTMPEFSVFPNINTSDASTIERYVYSNCTNEGSIELLKVLNGGHTWPGKPGPDTNRDIFTAKVIWQFLRKFKMEVINSTADQPSTVQMTISPNPASDFLNLTFSGNHNATSSASLMIVDLYGRIMLTRVLTGDEFVYPISIDLTSIPAGMYFLMIESTGGHRDFRSFVVAR